MENNLEFKNELPNSVDGVGFGVGFGEVIEALKRGEMATRMGWNGKNMFIVKQISSEIPQDIIPKLQSLPQSAKNLIVGYYPMPLKYQHQLLIIKADSTADSWIPSVSDIFAEDWIILK